MTGHSDPSDSMDVTAEPGGALPCPGCDAAVAAIRQGGAGHDVARSDDDGCWVVRMGHAEKLRSDNPCLACAYLRNRSRLLDDTTA